jgi:hypothetical protein
MVGCGRLRLPAALPRSLPSTTIANECENRIESSKTAFTPTGSAVTASWPMPSACSYMASPTTWSTCFVCWLSRRSGVRRRSRRCAHGYSRSVLAWARPRAASASTSPLAGRGNLFPRTRLGLKHRLALLLLFPNPFASARLWWSIRQELFFSFAQGTSTHLPGSNAVRHPPIPKNSAAERQTFSSYELSRLCLSHEAC